MPIVMWGAGWWGDGGEAGIEVVSLVLIPAVYVLVSHDRIRGFLLRSVCQRRGRFIPQRWLRPKVSCSLRSLLFR